MTPLLRTATLALATITAVTATALSPTSPSLATAGTPAAQAAAGEPATLASSELEVTVDRAFPQVVDYRHLATGEVLHGRAATLGSVVLNGTAYQPEVTSEVDATTARYTLSFPTVDVTLSASLSVDGHVVTFTIDEVTESGTFRVNTIDIPQHDLVSVRSTDAKAQVAAAKVDLSTQRTGDTIYPVTDATPPNASPIGSYFTLVSTGKVAAAMETNSVYDKPSGGTTDDNGHFWRQARKTASYTEVGVWSGQWTYRAATAADDDTEPAPTVKIAITGERNDDGATDWQDGAIALREIAYKPAGADAVKDRVVQRIPFNIASMATHPFLQTGDDTKRIALATDGLGQFAILKGYQSEGHDAAHPDYGGNYNTRAGGLDDLNKLLAEAPSTNTEYGVHVNATEAYPEAKAFSETLVNKNNPQWAWMDQSYRIDQRRDLVSGDVQDRFEQLRDETGGKLDLLYIDVFRESGWTADRLARELREQGYEISTEWSHRFVRDALWTHWSADFDYGGVDSKGINSKIMRFVDNHRRDVYIPHPLLGSAQIDEFEGWTGEVDYNAFLHNVWGTNLPVKFLQHFPIQRWTDTEIRLADGVTVAGTTTANRTITSGGAKVLDGDAYLLPWNPAQPTKLYHYNADGGSTTWQLTGAFAQARSLRLYQLTDRGRVSAGTVPVSNGKVTLTAAAKTAYVLYAAAPAAAPDPRYGAGTPVRDPGFNYGDLRAWNPSGAAAVERNGRGQFEAVLSGRRSAKLSQRLRGLEPGSYSASVDVEIEPGATRPTFVTVEPEGGRTATNRLDRSTLTNSTASDEKHGTAYQRVRVFFTVPRGGDEAKLALQTAAGAGRVRFDNVRVVPMAEPVRADLLASWDFEDVDAGWGPFYRGDIPVSDANTHLAELNAPYTQRGWNGKAIDDVISGEWSLKSYEYFSGISYRTTPSTVRFQPGRKYRVSFDYEAETADRYGWVLGVDGPAGSREVKVTKLPRQTDPTTHVQEFVAGGCGDYWVGLKRLPGNEDQVEFTLDGFEVEDLGRATVDDPCGVAEVASENENLLPGRANKVTTTFRNGETAAVTAVNLALALPEGWTATATGPATFDSVASGAAVSTEWAVTPPADTPTGEYDLVTTATYRSEQGARTVTGSTLVGTVPPPPTADTWASDLGWLSSSNGWGPVELDRANGESDAGDGPPLKLNGTTYEKGLGTHAPSEIAYYLGGNCARFTAQVGVDDYQTSRGSVAFQVVADGEVVAQSPVLRSDSAAYALEADLGAADEVVLRVTDGGDGVGNDHADWADARFHCGG
ncbi:endo-alpha-N-acetylgalactosaminidase family protein [Nocardioides speluncae]|uniref:endo-alpha-N-acetylgalactosaminidase family protein n=1 Tax=Nocardioides speluncae TaxID=2670337 RepID=UPI000D68C4C2|nr:endo-alpha-N-acetylgalactosaminidase family protein [Nocardioides speluncae]